MWQRAGGRRAEHGARRVGLHPRDQLFERADRDLRSRRDREVECRELRQRHEIVDRIVFEIFVDMLVHRHRRDRGDQQGAAVGRRVLHRGDAEAAGGAGPVLDNHRLAEGGVQAVADQSAQRIAGTARRERENDLDRLLLRL
jgi:hypothetical protein